MPSVVALRRWLVCVAGLRLMSGPAPGSVCPYECATWTEDTALILWQLRSLHRLVPSASATYKPLRSGRRLRCVLIHCANCGICKEVNLR